jgi:hypothetical protein
MLAPHSRVFASVIFVAVVEAVSVALVSVVSAVSRVPVVIVVSVSTEMSWSGSFRGHDG